MLGGNVRVGLEDNLWLDKGVLAENWQLVERAGTIIENMGARVIGAQDVRDKVEDAVEASRDEEEIRRGRHATLHIRRRTGRDGGGGRGPAPPLPRGRAWRAAPD